MHYIFLVHGMGNWAGTWSKDPEEIILRHYKKASYAFLSSRWPFDKHFKFEPLSYNHLFEEYLDKAKAQGDKLGQWERLKPGLGGGLVDALTGIVEIAKTDPNKENFVVTHLADVGLYMATNLGELVKNVVAEDIVKRLNKHKFNAAQGDTWSVIAHSLGTRVVNDVLQIGFAAQPSLRNFGKAQVVMMVSNVSRLLAEIPPWSNEPSVYRNGVFPSAGTLGVCYHYINVAHELDPFTFVRPFNPPSDFGDTNAFLDKVYHSIKLDMEDITSREIHSLEHYLEHPEVHSTLFRFLMSRRGKPGPTQKEFDDALEVYRLNTFGAQVNDAWRDSLQKLKDIEPRENLTQIFALWGKYSALLN